MHFAFATTSWAAFSNAKIGINMYSKLTNPTKPLFPIMLLLLGYITIAFYLGGFLQYDFFRSDVLGYWQDSLTWQTPFHPFHVPGYPWIVATIRGITFGVLNPVILMMGINLTAFLTSAFLVYQIIQAGGDSDELATVGTLLFGLWPFVGLTSTVVPLADMPAMLFFLVGLYLLQRSRAHLAALLLGLSLITHKAMWIFVGFFIAFDFIYRKEFISKRNLLFVGILVLPIAILWATGSFYHHSITWLFSNNLKVEVASKSSLPLLDGLLGTFMEGGVKGFVKGILLLSFAVFSAFIFYLSTRLKYAYFHYGMVISLAVLFLFLALNQHEIWAAMRFSRLLVIPLAFIANVKMEFKKELRWSLPIIITLLLLFLTQFAYSWYIARVYFG